MFWGDITGFMNVRESQRSQHQSLKVQAHQFGHPIHKGVGCLLFGLLIVLRRK